jgi:two-component system, NarL family, invasion response regulator UvrY
MSIGLLLLDDHVAVRAGYRRLLEADARFHVTGEAGSADDAYAMLQALEREQRLPQIAIVDIRLGGRTGFDFIEQAGRRFPALRFIVFSMHDSQPAIAHALRVGALGFVSKSSEPGDLLAAILAVSWGQQYLDDLCRQALASGDAAGERLKLLTPRELEILAQLLRGQHLDEIANALSLSPKTIANHLSAARNKLAVHNDFQLTRQLLERGWPGA